MIHRRKKEKRWWHDTSHLKGFIEYTSTRRRVPALTRDSQDRKGRLVGRAKETFEKRMGGGLREGREIEVTTQSRMVSGKGVVKE